LTTVLHFIRCKEYFILTDAEKNESKIRKRSITKLSGIVVWGYTSNIYLFYSTYCSCKTICSKYTEPKNDKTNSKKAAKT
jgi:hypothetical protein